MSDPTIGYGVWSDFGRATLTQGAAHSSHRTTGLPAHLIRRCSQLWTRRLNASGACSETFCLHRPLQGRRWYAC